MVSAREYFAVGFCIVDTCLLYKESQGCRDVMTPNDYFSKLAKQMIDTDFCSLTTLSSTEASTPTAVLWSGIVPHLTPTTMKRKTSDESATNAFYQDRCMECKNRTTLSALNPKRQIYGFVIVLLVVILFLSTKCDTT